MSDEPSLRIALLYPGDAEARKRADLDASRFRGVAEAFIEQGQPVEASVYADEFVEEVRDQLLRMDGVLVWVNPIESGRDRSVLDAMLREVAAARVFVSAHPDVILKLGTKEVLYHTRSVGWGADVDLYTNPGELCEKLSRRLRGGQVRVVKQYRGNGGNGVWRIERAASGQGEDSRPAEQMVVRIRHALRGAVEEQVPLGEFLSRCEEYFAVGGRMIDQAYQNRLSDGMIRCYLVRDRVEGFGFQAINALYPAPMGGEASEAPEPGPRLYHAADKPEFQRLKRKLEDEWVPAMLRRLDLTPAQLPVLWDADFLFGPREVSGGDTYVLCEINVSSVFPFPQSALPALVRATRAAVEQMRATRPGRS